MQKPRFESRAFVSPSRSALSDSSLVCMEGYGKVQYSHTELQLKSLEKVLIARRARSSYVTCFVISFLINHKTGSAIGDAFLIKIKDFNQEIVSGSATGQPFMCSFEAVK